MTTENARPAWAKWLFLENTPAFITEDIKGSDGNDTIGLDPGNQRVFLYGGDDKIFTYAQAINATQKIAISAGSGDDVVVGNTGQEYVDGGAGNDAIYGAGGNDYIYGGAGNDTISGGSGVNRLWGGAGNDTFILSGTDRIVDSEGADYYTVAVGANVSLWDMDSQTDVMQFTTKFDETMTFKRVGSNLVIKDADGIKVTVHDDFGKSGSGIEFFVDSNGHSLIMSTLDMHKGDVYSGADFML